MTFLVLQDLLKYVHCAVMDDYTDTMKTTFHYYALISNMYFSNYKFTSKQRIAKQLLFVYICIYHCDLKVLLSQAKIDENFANYFLETKANNKFLVVLKSTRKGLQLER